MTEGWKEFLGIVGCIAAFGLILIVVVFTISTVERKSRLWRIDACIEKYPADSKERMVCLRGY